MEIVSAEIEQLLDQLAQTPTRLRAASNGLDDAHLHAPADVDAWSARDIIAHLRACSDVWGRSIVAMIKQDQPVLRYISPRTWIRKTDYLQVEFQQSLKIFAQERAELLASLQALNAEEWSRGATFTGTTRGREQTVWRYAQRLARHEDEHCQQIEALVTNGQGERHG